MKKLFAILLLSCFVFACKSTKMAVPASNTNSRTASDTALQGDKMKNPAKQ